MSRVYKIKMQGVRAFSEEAPVTIELFTPLTLIVGQNGTGKTTVIEALKYATTGAQPPNTKTGAFVNDPRLKGETESNAHVLMRFTSCAGDDYVVARGMTQRVGRAKRETKTTESALWKREGKEKTLICSKVTGVDAEVPALLGTTPAVLENVIFCHQEESTWPLGDATAVKKRIDGVFSSEKYIKALDTLTQLKKEKGAETKLLQCKYETQRERVESKKKVQQRAERVRERLDTLKREQETWQIRVNTLQQEKKEREREEEDAREKMRRKERIDAEIKALEGREIIRQPIDKLKQMQRSAERVIIPFAEREMHLLQEQEKVLEAKISVHAERREESKRAVFERDRLEKKKIALLNTKKEETKKEIERIEADWSKAKEILQKINIYVEDKEEEGRTDATRIKKRVEYAEKALNEQERQMQILSWRKAEQDRQKELIQKKEAARIIEIETQLQELQNEKEKEDKEEKENSSIEDKEEETKDVKDILQLEEQKKALICEIEELQKEIDQALEDADRKREKKELQKEINRNRNEISALLRTEELPEEIKQIRNRRSSLEKEREKVEEIMEKGKISSAERANKERELESIREREIYIRKEKSKRIKELLQQISGSIEEKLEPITKAEVVVRIERGEKIVLDTDMNNAEGYLLHTEKVAALSALERVYAEFLEKASNSCPFCSASMTAAVAKGRIQRIEKILEKIKEEKRIEIIEREKERETKIRKQKDNEIKRSINEISAFGQVFQQKIEDIEQITNSEKIEIEANNAESLIVSLTKRICILQEIEHRIKEIQQMEEREKRICITSREYDTIRREYALKMQQIKEIDREIQVETKKEEKKRKRATEIENVKRRKKEWKEQKNTLNKELTLLINARNHRLQIKNSKRNDKNEMDENEIYENKRSILQSARSIVQGVLPQPERVAKMLSLSAQIKEVQEQLSQIQVPIYSDAEEREERKLTEEIKEIQQRIKDAERTVQQMNKAKAHAQIIKDSIRMAELLEKAKELTEVEDILEDAQKRVKETRMQLEITQRGAAECIGEMHNLEIQRQENERDFAEYAGAEEAEMAAYIAVKVLKESILDLDKYIKALQMGIVRYHSEKLEEVNAIIKEIWSVAYTGGDIERIKICAQLDKTYAMVMEKDGVQVEMRGRVSAGQKMLASIVVRLALAEAFSMNCGLMSLDEPTTNLDKQNICALARAISSIIKARRAEGSFQLLVITHDEDFVRELLREECTEYFYRVRRDDNMVPRIEKFSIYER